MSAHDLEIYKPRTLCEVCENACGGCSWSEAGVQKPVEGWDAVQNDLWLGDPSVTGRFEHYQESYVVLHCPEFKLEERNRWAFERFDPEAVRARPVRAGNRKERPPHA